MKCFTLHVMNLKYMKVSLFEISYKKKLTYSRHSNLLRCTCTFTQLLSNVFLNKYNKTFSCDLTWSVMTKCIMKKNWTCPAGALELMLASCFIRQFMRLIVHFYSKLILNHHRVFVITSFCDHVEFGRLLLLKYAFYSLLYHCKNEHFRCKLHIHLKKIT